MKQYNRECAYCFTPIAYNKGEKPDKCPCCGATNFIKPPTETKLFKLQHYYLENRQQGYKEKADRYLGDLFFLIKHYAEGKIKKKIKHTVSYPEDRLDEKSEEIAVWFLESYMNDPEFKVEQSFGGLLEGKVLKALYAESEKRDDAMLSLDMPVGEDEDSFLIDQIDAGSVAGSFFEHDSFYDEYLMRLTECDDLVFSMDRVISEILREIRLVSGLASQMYFLIGLYARIAGKTDDDMSEYYSMAEKTYTEEAVNKALAIILGLLKDNIEHRGFVDDRQRTELSS